MQTDIDRGTVTGLLTEPTPTEIAEAKARHTRACARKLADAMGLECDYDGVPADLGYTVPPSESDHALDVTAARMLPLVVPAKDSPVAVAADIADYLRLCGVVLTTTARTYIEISIELACVRAEQRALDGWSESIARIGKGGAS